MARNKSTKIQLLSRQDLDVFKRHISEAIELATGKALLTLENYHYSHFHLHERMAPKSARIFKPAVVKEILNLHSIQNLKNDFSSYTISNIVDENGVLEQPEVYFRLARPGAMDDVGCPHMDNWFHRSLGLPLGESSTYKVLLSICTEPGLNGLNFFPNVDIANLQYSYSSGKVYCANDQPALGAPELQMVRPGDALVFRDDVLHSGAINRGSKTRVSVEITFVPEERK
jgi:hypothetical protein